MKELRFSDGFSSSFKLAINQFWSVLGAILLWIITIWIPYINVGTTIGLIQIQIKLGRGEKISADEIFDGKHRAVMGKIFLLWSFMTIGIVIGTIFLIVPGIVLWHAWFLSTMLILDKKLDPIQAMSKSYDLTYGYKWVMFFITFAINLAFSLVSVLTDPETWAISEYYEPGLFLFLIFLTVAVSLVGGVWLMAAYGYIYATLSGSKKK